MSRFLLAKFAPRLLLLLLSLKAIVEVKAQNKTDSSDPDKENSFNDLIKENNLDEK